MEEKKYFGYQDFFHICFWQACLSLVNRFTMALSPGAPVEECLDALSFQEEEDLRSFGSISCCMETNGRFRKTWGGVEMRDLTEAHRIFSQHSTVFGPVPTFSRKKIYNFKFPHVSLLVPFRRILVIRHVSSPELNLQRLSLSC